MTTVIDRTTPAPGPNAAKRTRLPLPKAITVNGVVISRSEIARETQNHPATKPIEAWTAAARALVVRELLLQEARGKGIEAVPLTDAEGRRETDDEALIRQIVECATKTPEPDEATCRRIYERDRARFRSESIYAVRHILIPAPAGDSVTRAKAHGRAESLLSMLRSGQHDFATLAVTNSACPSFKQGGNLGQISRGQTVPEFEEALESIEDMGLVETRYGWHVVAVDQRIPGQDLPFELVAPHIAAWLTERAQRTAIKHYLEMLASNATIIGIDLSSQSLA